MFNLFKVKPELNKNAIVVKNKYPELPQGTIVTVNDIQWNFYGINSHRYWAIFNEQNYSFNQKELIGF